ncbi:hypothetical protein [Ligilactobacillus equi]|uniref:Uncharacterized protein n=1 Tax=Ligilactobacillus equi DSM 15833 = JCM 10991 TaxID=1423740 RepID=A0A0R1TL87_9LACO|nr:hypothetical protein [Ligilactobacillus equi]KRL80644.1 hypothetical protein FC36_GL002100 [Ligilactobacillus equi DSM 15833 = JCM 10991]
MIKKLLNWLFSKGEEEKPVSEETWRGHLEEKIDHNRNLIELEKSKENPDYKWINQLKREIEGWEKELRSGNFKGYY